MAAIKFFLLSARMAINFSIAITADHSQDVTSHMGDFFVLYYINSIWYISIKGNLGSG